MTQKKELEVNSIKENLKTIVISTELSKKDLVQGFRDLFSGREDCWGKPEGKCVREELDNSHYVKHLEGKESLGIYTTQDDGTCRFAVVDFDFKEDEDRENKARLSSVAFIKRLKAIGIESSWMEISKSNLIHVWVFFEESIPAIAVRNLFQYLLNKIGLEIRNGYVEIFPKQDSLEDCAIGNYINLPYYGAFEGSSDFRIMYDLDTNQTICIEEFLESATKKRVSSDQIKQALKVFHDSTNKTEITCVEVPVGTLIEDQRNLIIYKLNPYWRLGNRQDLAMCLSGYLAKQDIKLQVTLEIISQLSKICDDKEITQRLSSAKSTYNRYQKGNLIKGFSGLKEILNPKDLDEISKVFDSRSNPTQNQNVVKPLSRDAYHGITGEIVDYIEPNSEADPAAILINFLTGIGNLLGSKIYYKVEGNKHCLRIFVVLVGDTAKARKGTSWGHIGNLLIAVDSSYEERIQEGLSSGEGLIAAVCEADSDKRLLLNEGEFSSVLKRAHREGNTLSQTMRVMWDSGDVQVMTKHNPIKVKDTHISMIGHITADELKQQFHNIETANGFGNRFLWFCISRSKELPLGGNIDYDKMQPLIARLKSIAEFAKNESELKWSQEAIPMWTKVYSDLSRGELGVYGAMTARAEAYVVRLACLYAVLDMSNEIRLEHLRAALEVWRYSQDSVRHLFGSNVENTLEDRILTFIESSESGVSRTDINDFLSHNVHSDLINQKLNALESKGLITIDEIKTAGRPKEIYRSTKLVTK